MVNVDEEFVRAMARDQAELVLPLELAQLPPEPPPKPVKGQPIGACRRAHTHARRHAHTHTHTHRYARARTR